MSPRAPLRSGSRRDFLGALTAAGAAAWIPPAALSAPRRTLDLDDPRDALTAMVKMRGSLEPEDVPHWYYGTIYAVLPGRAPLPLVDYEGSEIDFYARQSDGSWHAHAATVSLFRDRATGRRIEVFENPLNGRRREVLANSISVDAYYVYTTRGFRRSDDPRPIPDDARITDRLEWREAGPHVWLTTRRAYPAGLTMGEHQVTRGSRAELYDPDAPKVYTTAAPTYVSPFLPWMGMDGVDGHTVWAGPAVKLDRVEEYPAELLAFMERHFPEKLTARP